MGKSPAKWVKNIILGKRSSKSYPSKKAADEDKESVPAQASSRELNATSNMSNLAPHTTTTEVNSEFKQARSITTSSENDIPAATNQASNEVSAIGSNLSKEAENLELEEAATEVQAVLRGFMSRQAYHSLKGFIRLQALVRGHLVRRQALATLHCVRGVVKLQAVVRGRRIRRSDIGLEVHKKCSFQEADVTESIRFGSSIIQVKQSSNAFARKILASSISALPLNLQYDPDEPNSASKWLERWSSSHFWGSTSHQKEALGLNSQQQGNQTVGAESRASGAPKLEARRAAPANMENNLVHSSFGNGKSKHINRKPSSQQVESLQYHPENELERVKQNLRKISLNNKEATGKSDPVVEMPKTSKRNLSVSPAPDSRSKSEASTGLLSQRASHISNSAILDSGEHVLSDPIVDEISPSGTESESLVVPEPVHISHDDLSEPCIGANGVGVGKSSLTNEEQVLKDERSIDNDNKLLRKSVPTKQEYYENASQNTRSLRSYMAATESARAKLRGLGSPKFAQEGDEDAVIRRHSLPSSTNGKLSSMSPRIQKVVGHANGKDRTRSDRSLTSSKDGHGKVLRPEWRR